MKKKTAPKMLALGAVLSRLLAIPLLVLWFVSMALLTWAGAMDMYHQLEAAAQLYLHKAIGNIQASTDKTPGASEHQMLLNLSPSLTIDPLLPLNLSQQQIYQAAVAFCDGGGRILFQSGDYLYFPYTHRSGLQDPAGYAYIDLEALEGGKVFADRYLDPVDHSPFGMRSLELTGHFEGNRFYPITILTKGPGGQETVFSRNAEPGQALVTIYTADPKGYNYDPGTGFTLNGVKYSSPAALLEDWDSDSCFGLFSAVVEEDIHFYRNDALTYAKIAVHCRPLPYALLGLLPVYLTSLLLILIAFVLLRRYLKKTLTEPMHVILRAYEQNRVALSKYAASPILELQALAEHFNTKQQALHQSQNETRQLQASLEYATDAEENRRKMVSAIAHELKTPLAVIHSYAEGLQAGIAAEKQEKYLSVITQETEQMDALVLEMLELSRLEAGKVRLNTDQFSLLRLTQEIFDRLSLAAQARELHIQYVLQEDFLITADEARLAQVITNLATNAIKYTPCGGSIRIKVHRVGRKALLSVENDSPPLSEETLSQIWDSFYRADSARSGSGTGLGLAIVKSIVGLHRGECTARNTKSGVEFGIRLPI